MKRRAQRAGMNPRETCDSVSVLLNINGKQSSRKNLRMQFFGLCDRRFGKEKQKSESAVCEGILIPYTESEGNLFHSQKNGIAKWQTATISPHSPRRFARQT